MKKEIDQVTLAILVNNLYWIAEEMNAYLTRSAFSTNIKVRRDCSCAIYTANGDMVAQGEFVPVHLGIMSQALREALKIYPANELKDGDVIIHNDPYSMGSHLWDIMLFKPIFNEGELIAFTGNLAHHVDIGGATTSRNLPTVYEEGLRLPPVKLYEEGKLQESIFRLITANVRTPYEVRGDLAAQTAANFRGERRVKEVAQKYGNAVFREYLEEILNYSERGMRQAIRETPDCEADFEDYVEHDGIKDVHTKIKVTIRIQGDEIWFDFDGSGAPGEGGVNAPWSLTHSAVYYAVKAVLGNNIPTNDGAYRPIHLIRPQKESIVDAKFPHAVGGCTSNPTQRVVDAAIGAFSKIVPEKACACDGHWPSGRFVGFDSRTGRYSPYVETYACGRGAKYNDDGADAHQTHMTNTANAPIEIIEMEHPLRVEKYAIVPDSGGPGEYRGGTGIVREVVSLTDMSVNAFHVRPHIKPYGLFGGKGGSNDFCGIFLSDGRVVSSSKDVKAGDHTIIQTSGGGGWGYPYKRKIESVLEDVKNGYVSLKAAETEYGVAIDGDTYEIDTEKTNMLRKEMERAVQRENE